MAEPRMAIHHRHANQVLMFSDAYPRGEPMAVFELGWVAEFVHWWNNERSKESADPTEA